MASLAHRFTRHGRRNVFFLVGALVALAFATAGGEVATVATVTPAASGAANALNHRSSNSFTVADAKDAPSKRNANGGVDLSGSASAKSYDPPPEFYRAPGSTSGGSGGGGGGGGAASSSSGGHHSSYGDSATAGFISKPVAFPDTTGRNHYGADGGSGGYLANAYNNWQLLKGSATGLGTHSLQDRISVKHYGSPEHGSSGSGASGYAYSDRPYVSGGGGGGGAHYSEYPPSHAAHYGSTAHDGGGGGVGGGGGSYYGSPDGIPFDVYGSKGHYAGAGGEYSYTYPVGGGGDAHEPPTHKGHHHHELSPKALLAKSFLIPLASAAVLGIAAALISNPLLLQLGTVSTGVAVTPGLVGKRKRRDLAAVDDARLTGKQALAYRAQIPKPDDGDTDGPGQSPAAVPS